MLRAYLDASQTVGPPTVPGPPLLAVAGFVGESDQSARGQGRWSAALSKAGAECFHMTDFEAKQEPPWSEWTEQKRRGVLDRLVTLTASSVLMGTAAVVRMDDYDGLAKDVRRRVGSPYLLAACACVSAIARWCEGQGIDEKVMYVFEGGDLGLPQFREAPAQLVEKSDDFKNRMRLLSITVGSKRDVPLLQMAGILAWEVTHHMPRCLGFDSTPARRSMERLLEAVPVEAEYFDARALRAAADRHTPEDYARAAEIFGMAMKADRKSPDL